MVIRKTIITLSLAALIAQPALSANKATCLKKGIAYGLAPKVAKGTKIKNPKVQKPIVNATKRFVPEVFYVKPSPANPVIAADAFSFNNGLRAAYDSNTVSANESFVLTASKYAELTQAALSDARQVINEYAVIANDNITKNCINPLVRNFNQVTKQAIEKFENSDRSKVAYTVLQETVYTATNKLTTGLNQVATLISIYFPIAKDATQKAAIDFAALTRQYVAKGAKYASNNPKTAHGILAATMTAALAATMIPEQQEDKTTRVQASAARLAELKQANIKNEAAQELALLEKLEAQLEELIVQEKAAQVQAAQEEAVRELEVFIAQEEAAQEAAHKAAQEEEVKAVYAEYLTADNEAKAILEDRKSKTVKGQIKQAYQTTSNWLSQSTKSLSSWWYKGAKSTDIKS